MPNTPIEDHRWIGQGGTYRSDLPPYDAAADTEGGTLILGNGMRVEVRAVFADWNGVAGLDMLYVFVPDTGFHTHVTPRDLGWSQPVMCDGLPLHQTTCPDRAGHM